MQVLSSGHAARDYQDERFSYVVLSKGPRPFSPGLASAPISPFLSDDPRQTLVPEDNADVVSLLFTRSEQEIR